MGRRANGEGSIGKMKDGRWWARATLPDGRRKAVYGKTRAAVAAKLTSVLKSNQDGSVIPSDQLTTGQYLSEWVQNYRGTVRESTWWRYEQLIRIHAVPQIGRIRLSRLEPRHLESLYRDRLDQGLAGSTVKQLHNVIHNALDQAHRRSHITRNVASLVQPPRVPRSEIKPLSLPEANRLLDAARGDRLEALYVLALATGMRKGELQALCWRDIDLQRADLHIQHALQRTPEGYIVSEPKSDRSRRRIMLPKIAVDALRSHRATQAEERLALGSAWDNLDLVFANRAGRHLDGGHVLRRSLRPLLIKAGLPPIRFHDLRHTAATILLCKGVHVKVVSEMLGHSSIALTLDTYSHVLPHMQTEAAAAMDEALSAF